MFLIIAFLGGMISLLSPCTLPVIPLLFAGFQGQRRQILALLSGMIVMFTLVAMVVTVASDSIAQATVIGRGVALVILAVAALALIFPQFAQRIAGPAVAAGNVLNARSGQTRGVLSAFLGGLAVGLLWSPCAGPILGAIFSINIAGHSAIATGAPEAGLTTGDYEEASIKRAFSGRAAETVVLASPEKINAASSFVIGGLSLANTVVVEANTDRAWINAIEEKGVSVVKAA